MKYQKRPIVIEAFCLGTDPIPGWFMDKVTSNEIVIFSSKHGRLDFCVINTLEGAMEGKRGDWIIQGIQGEIYPCKPDIFEQTYIKCPESEQ